MNLLTHLFFPHDSNNQRAKLLHIQILLSLSLLFVSLGFALPAVHQAHPQVLGVHIDVSSQDLLLLTNKERIAAGLQPLSLNEKLADAAEENAQYMFAHNYWSHFAPDGTSPWIFFKKVDYDYKYAGQNLARGYNSAQDVVDAWMKSPDHRENILSKNYTDVGFAIEQGELTGEKDTVLIVQMFGSTDASLASLKNVSQNAAKTIITDQMSNSILGNSQQALVKEPLIDIGFLGQKTTFIILAILLLVLALDLFISRSRKLSRVVGHNFDHILYISAVIGYLLFAIGGAIG